LLAATRLLVNRVLQQWRQVVMLQCWQPLPQRLQQQQRQYSAVVAASL
jgi:hypothetical protein